MIKQKKTNGEKNWVSARHGNNEDDIKRRASENDIIVILMKNLPKKEYSSMECQQ